MAAEQQTDQISEDIADLQKKVAALANLASREKRKGKTPRARPNLQLSISDFIECYDGKYEVYSASATGAGTWTEVEIQEAVPFMASHVIVEIVAEAGASDCTVALRKWDGAIERTALFIQASASQAAAVIVPIVRERGKRSFEYAITASSAAQVDINVTDYLRLSETLGANFDEFSGSNFGDISADDGGLGGAGKPPLSTGGLGGP